VHIHVQRIPAADLPPDAAECEAFLAKSFEEKEARLARFYTQGIPLDAEHSPAQVGKGERKGKGAEEATANATSTTSSTTSRGYARAARAAYAQGLLVMALTAAAAVVLARWLSPLAFWGYVLGATGVTLVVIHCCEGWDSVELRLAGEEEGRDKAA
jgi:hypothetical protein